MNRIAVSIICISFVTRSVLYGQDGALQGKVVSQKSKEPLIGVNIIIDDTSGTVTGIDGHYLLKLSPGIHSAQYRFLGFKTQVHKILINQGETVTKNIELAESVTELDIVVVSAGKFEQRIEDVTVSMEVIKPQLVTSKNTYNLENLMDQIPGVNIVDGQCNIRGGSGYSYGAGSRVLVLVDDIPALASDANDVKWNFLPVENLEQIEVIKGASSALFGSSALNGVINIRTAYPKDIAGSGSGKPVNSQTIINVFHGFYFDPVRRDTLGNFRDSSGNLYKPLKWWNNSQQIYTGANLMHSRKIKNLDLVVGGNIFSDQGYRLGEYEQWTKGFANTRYRFKNKLEGLSVGLNTTLMRNNGGWFFIWADADSGAYIPKGGLDTATTTISIYTTTRTNIDPYIAYVGKKGMKLSFRNRYLNTNNMNNTNMGSNADYYYTEFQFQKQSADNFTFTTGYVETYSVVKSQLYGDHFGSNFALYAQADKRFNRLSISLGFRGEYYRLDTAQTVSTWELGSIKLPLQPVMRSGLNYRLLEETYLRASFGQGYRFPSIAEKYISTSVSVIKVLPNPGLQPELGWSSELGIKHGFKVSNWKGYLDFAGFWTEYRSMIEFTFGTFYPASIHPDSMLNDPAGYFMRKYGFPNLALAGKAAMDTVLAYTGFKSLNIGSSQIRGFEFSMTGTGKIGNLTAYILGGYTFMDPVNFNRDSSYISTLSDPTNNILKYRFRHMAKVDIQLVYGKFTAGWSTRYNSFTENVDAAFEDPVIIRGVRKYRSTHNKGDVVCDARLSYSASENSRISLVSNNIFNREYMGRPGDMQPPRTLAIQYSMKF
ncbi:MAG: TonB-dependent receptor [Bacteroidetes bacterium]|nr:TonB-dependent receptor [Bacteroidota bacterium]